MLPDFSFVLVKAAFEVMKKGEKLEEFRDNTEYWRARLLEAHDKFRQFKHQDAIACMTQKSETCRAPARRRDAYS